AQIPLDERLQLVEDIWDSIAELPESVEVPKWHRPILEERLKAYHEDPHAGTPWSELKREITG
ncbi:MAG: addiction module protein, partial [Candidatus Thiodiazotropha sp.]